MYQFTRTLSLLLILIFASKAAAQPGKLEPARPVWHRTLRVTYDTAHAQASLASADRVFAELIFERPDRSEVCILLELAPEDAGVLSGRAEVPAGAATLECTFFDATPVRGPGALRPETLIAAVDAGPGVPAPGAVVLDIPTRFPTDDLLEAELARYPEAVQVFETRWDAMDAARQRGKISDKELERLLRQDLARLAAMPETEAVLALLPYGYALAGDSAAAAASLQKLMHNHPNSLYLRMTAGFALWATANRHGIEGNEFARLRDLQVEHCTRHPGSPMAISTWRDTINWGLPLHASEETFQVCQQQEPDHPDALLALALAYDSAGEQITAEQLKRGVDAASRAAAAYASGERRLRDLLGPSGRVDRDGSLSERYLPEARSALASLLLRSQQWKDAVEAAQSVRECPGVRTPLVAASWLTQGRALLGSGNNLEGEEALLRAYLMGAPKAAEVLRARHTAAGGDPEAFEQVIAARARLVDLTDGKPLPEAPPLDGTTLEGLALTEEALRGKVVVLNFWFLACAPCLAEMPALNRLVEAYHGRDDVIFLAVATDAEDKLKKFLDERRFLYRTVSDADRSICRRFDLAAFPTHVVIGPDGRIVHTLVGACHDPIAVLGPIIEWAAARQEPSTRPHANP